VFTKRIHDLRIDQAARTSHVLGEEHPLTRIELSIAALRDQAAVCLAIVAATPTVIAVNPALGVVVLLSGLVTLLTLGLVILLLGSTRRDRVHDVILAGQRPPLPAVHAELNRLRSPQQRRRLAETVRRALTQGERWHDYMPASRPPIGVRNLPAHRTCLLQIAAALEHEPVSIRAVIMVERFIRGGYGSAIYDSHPDTLRQELGRIHFELETRPD
jgi:hypothetical protein